MAKKNVEENVVENVDTEKARTFEDFKAELLGASAKSRTVDDWNTLADEVMSSKGLTDNDKARLTKSIQIHISDMNEEAQKEAQKEAEPVIINDGLRNGRKNQKVMAVSSKTENAKVLGYCTFQTVGASSVPNEVVEKFCDEHNIPASIRPRKAQPLDAFARACQTLKRSEVKQVEKGQVECSWDVNNLKGDDAGYMITRRILIEDENGKRDLGWQNIARCTLEGSGEDKNFKIVVKPATEVKGVKTLCDNIQKELRDTYQNYMDNIMDKQIRDALRNTIYKANGIPFTSGRGGAWFVPIQAQPLLEGWREFAKLVNTHYTLGGFPVSIRLIPLADVDEYKEMVEEDVQRAVHDQMEALLTSTLKALENAQKNKKDGKPLSDDTLDKILGRKLEEHASTIDMLEDYKKMLGRNVKINLKKLDEMLDNVETPLSERHQVALRKLASLQTIGKKPAKAQQD